MISISSIRFGDNDDENLKTIMNRISKYPISHTQKTNTTGSGDSILAKCANVARQMAWQTHIRVPWLSAKPPNTRTLCYTHSIGVFRLCAGNDRLDELPVRHLGAGLRCVFRRRARLHSVDDHRWAVLAGAATECDGHRSAGQLVGELCRRHRLPDAAGTNGSHSRCAATSRHTTSDCCMTHYYPTRRTRWRTTRSCRSACCWPSSGYSRTRRCPKRRTKRLRKFWRCSVTETRGELFGDQSIIQSMCHNIHVRTHKHGIALSEGTYAKVGSTGKWCTFGVAKCSHMRSVRCARRICTRS